MIGEQGDRRRNPAGLDVQPAEFFLNRGSRADRNRLVEVLLGLIDAAEHQLAPARRQQGSDAVRVQLQRPRRQRLRGLPFPAPDLGLGLLGQHVSLHAIRVEDVGNAFPIDRLGEVPHRLEAQFRGRMRRLEEHLLHPPRQVRRYEVVPDTRPKSLVGGQIDEGMAAG